jgi:hypothetical protein
VPSGSVIGWPKRRPSKAAKPVVVGPVVVTARKPGRRYGSTEAPASADPEATARVVAFFKGMGLTWVPVDED